MCSPRITSPISSDVHQMAPARRLYDGRLFRWNSLCLANGDW
jgi:hypothetical protein